MTVARISTKSVKASKCKKKDLSNSELWAWALVLRLKEETQDCEVMTSNLDTR